MDFHLGRLCTMCVSKGQHWVILSYLYKLFKLLNYLTNVLMLTRTKNFGQPNQFFSSEVYFEKTTYAHAEWKLTRIR